MKIKRIQITIEPATSRVPGDGYQTFTVEVRADGRIFRTISSFDDDHFQDVFGHLIRDAERSIRTMINAGETSS